MKIFRDKELEARLDTLEETLYKIEIKLDKLSKKPNKPKTNSDTERIQKIEDSFQKLFNYNEDIATRGYKK